MEKLLFRKINVLYSFISHPYGFVTILFILIAWFAVGFIMDYDEKWYKIIHLFEIVVTLLMLFVIEFTQQAELRAIQEKLDELLKKLPHTNSKKAGIEKRIKGQTK